MPVQKKIIEQLEQKFKENNLEIAVDTINDERQISIKNSNKKMLIDKIRKRITNKCAHNHRLYGKNSCIKSNMTEVEKMNKKNLYNKSFNNIHEITFKSSSSDRLDRKIMLKPYYYNSDFDSISKQFIEQKGAFGDFSSIYLKYYNTTESKLKTNIIFKLTTPNNNELFGLYFNFLIYKFYFYNQLDYPNSLKYLCKLYEFGEVHINKNELKYYAYMDNCGLHLSELSKKITNLSMLLIKELLLQTLESLKLIHDFNYLHLDINNDNFLFTLLSNELQIKIIDFGFTKKINFQTNNIFGKSIYLSNDWLKNESNKENTILEYHHDFFSLGIVILNILKLYGLFESSVQMFCPMGGTMHITVDRINYNLEQHNNDMDIIKELLLSKFGIDQTNNINIIVDKLLFRMIHPIPEQRINDINELLEIVDRIKV